MIQAHQTAPTQFVEANGIRFAYRRFGKAGIRSRSSAMRIASSLRSRPWGPTTNSTQKWPIFSSGAERRRR
jgi:hypothetical protein